MRRQAESLMNASLLGRRVPRDREPDEAISALRCLQTPYNGDGPAQVLFEPSDHRAAVVAIAPQQLDLGKELLDWRKPGLGSGHGRIGGQR